MEKFFSLFERIISITLMLVAVVGITYLTLELVYELGAKLIHSIQHRTFEPQEHDKPLVVLFFTILLWLEIIQSIRYFAENHAIKLKTILLIGIIAITRKVLLLDMMEPEPMVEFAVAGLIVALTLGYFLVHKSDVAGGHTRAD
ncbi:MAG: phosphate-starvation-inducible PsiE family protein [Saprospiraceae bacterium]|nr:phosphate-starvation-inducible PsiE family protein [Saprospiraceae bacterium]